jgi:hypothetical protein
VGVRVDVAKKEEQRGEEAEEAKNGRINGGKDIVCVCVMEGGGEEKYIDEERRTKKLSTEREGVVWCAFPAVCGCSMTIQSE